MQKLALFLLLLLLVEVGSASLEMSCDGKCIIFNKTEPTEKMVLTTLRCNEESGIMWWLFRQPTERWCFTDDFDTKKPIEKETIYTESTTLDIRIDGGWNTISGRVINETYRSVCPVKSLGFFYYDIRGNEFLLHH